MSDMIVVNREEPSMDDILSSIRRILSDDDEPSKPAVKESTRVLNQDEIDSLLGFDDHEHSEDYKTNMEKIMGGRQTRGAEDEEALMREWAGFADNDASSSMVTEWEAMLDSPLKEVVNAGQNNTQVSTDFTFSISCGDWIYPSKDSTCKVKYDIDFPLTTYIFVLPSQHQIHLDRGGSDKHLSSARRLHCTCRYINQTEWEMELTKLTNDYEPAFVRLINIGFKFNFATLPRLSEYKKYIFSNDDNRSRWLGIFFADVLLENYLLSEPNTSIYDDPRLKGVLTIRKSTIPEIESIGRWSSY